MSEQPQSGTTAPPTRAADGDENAILDASLHQVDARLLSSLRQDEARRRRRKALIGGGIVFITIATAALGFFLSQSKPADQKEWARVSPFTRVEVAGDSALVQYEGDKYELVSIEDLPTEQILAFSRKTHGGSGEKRFAEDLFEVLSGMGKVPGKTVKLVLRDPLTSESKTVDRALMTHENRQAVWKTLQKKEINDTDRERAAALAAEGWELFQKRELASAESRFDQATELDPDSANVWNGLGWAKFNSGDSAGGQKAFEEAIWLEPEHAAARNGLGYIHFNNRKYKDAEKHWLVAVKNPNATAPYYGLAKMYLLTGKFDQALTYAEKALKDQPMDASLQAMVEAARKKRLTPELRKEIEPVISKKPSGGETAKGWQAFNRGEPKKARELFEAALKKDPNDMAAHNGLGFVLLNSGKPADAKKHFQACLDADPKAAGPMNGLARCLKEEGKLDEAIAMWEKMVKLYPGVNAGTYGLAEAYFQKEEYAKSVKMYEQIAAAEPNNEQVKEALNRARQTLDEKK